MYPLSERWTPQNDSSVVFFCSEHQSHGVNRPLVLFAAVHGIDAGGVDEGCFPMLKLALCDDRQWGAEHLQLAVKRRTRCKLFWSFGKEFCR